MTSKIANDQYHKNIVTSLPSYVGITGFVNSGEVDEVLRCMPDAPQRMLMCGVLLANDYLFDGIEITFGRYPKPRAIQQIFRDDPRCMNIIHYCPRANRDLADSLERATTYGGDKCDGIQINIRPGMDWPAPDAIMRYRERCSPERVVMQIGNGAMRSAGYAPSVIANWCAMYDGVVTDLLLDTSAGAGVEYDVDLYRVYVSAISDAAPSLGIVVAGGLCASNLDDIVGPILAIRPDVSIDAEGRLRDGNDDLIIRSANEYIAKSLEIMR